MTDSVARRCAARATALLALLLVLAGTAGSAQPARTRKAFHYPSKCITDTPSHHGRSILPELRRLGVRVWSTGISWAEIAPSRPANPTSPDDPAYQWPIKLDGFLKEARANGIEPVLYVVGFPAWSNGGRDSRWVPRDPKDFANFMAAAVRRYPEVRRWLVFSEPGNSLNFMPQGGKGSRAPRLYARLLDAAYVSMHAARQNVVVIGGNVHPSGNNDQFSTAPDRFLRYMVLPSGRRPRLDMFGINPYTERPLNMALGHHPRSVDFNDLDWLAQQLDRYWPKRHLQIFVDEFGWNTEHEAYGWLYYVSRKKQATNLRRAYALAAGLGRVDTLCWYQLYDSPPARNSSQWLNWTSGLRTSSGVRKPAWWTYRRVSPGPPRA